MMDSIGIVDESCNDTVAGSFPCPFWNGFLGPGAATVWFMFEFVETFDIGQVLRVWNTPPGWDEGSFVDTILTYRVEGMVSGK